MTARARARSVFAELLDALFAPLTDAHAKRTLCCNVIMHDLWMHADTCPQYQAKLTKVIAWQEEHPNASVTEVPFEIPKRGDKGGLCPDCGYPTGHYGIYTVGQPCSWCEYVEKRMA